MALVSATVCFIAGVRDALGIAWLAVLVCRSGKGARPSMLSVVAFRSLVSLLLVSSACIYKMLVALQDAASILS